MTHFEVQTTFRIASYLTFEELTNAKFDVKLYDSTIEVSKVQVKLVIDQCMLDFRATKYDMIYEIDQSLSSSLGSSHSS